MTVAQPETPPAESPPVDAKPADAQSTEVPPADASPAPAQLNIVIRRQNNSCIHFLIKVTTPLDKLMKFYCIISKLPANGVRLRYDGAQVCRSDTPLSLNMEEGDILEALHDC